MSSLNHTQRIFFELITAPEGVRQGLDSLADRERRLPQGLEGLIAGDERLSAIARLDVYANMYFYRILDILKEDFPAVLAVVGDVRFHNLVTSYLIEHPSTHPSVRYLGRQLASFIARHDLSKEWPWLADLARLEWAILEAFDGPDAEPLDAARLRELPPERWASARFRFAPTLQVVKATAPVHVVWSRANEGEPFSAIEAEPTNLRVWRKDLGVLHRVIPAVELAALEAVLAGEDFGGACEAVAA
ncbi:MAG: HvfC/BufC family peptide modification chaperone, partial [Candidatus Binatia bacterium]